MGPIERKAITLTNVAVPAKTTVAFDTPLNLTLLVAQETVAEETPSDGTTVAETRPYSKIVSIKGKLQVHGLAADELVRWVLYKDVDGENVLTTLIDSWFHSTADTPSARDLRAKTIAKGMIVGSDRTAGTIYLNARRSLRRNGSLRENDKIRLLIASSDTAMQVSGFGTIYVRTN